MKKFKVSFCSNECNGVRYFTDIMFGTFRSAEKVLNALEKEGYEVRLYRRKKGTNIDIPWNWEQIENAS